MSTKQNEQAGPSDTLPPSKDYIAVDENELINEFFVILATTHLQANPNFAEKTKEELVVLGQRIYESSDSLRG